MAETQLARKRFAAVKTPPVKNSLLESFLSVIFQLKNPPTWRARNQDLPKANLSGEKYQLSLSFLIVEDSIIDKTSKSTPFVTGTKVFERV